MYTYNVCSLGNAEGDGSGGSLYTLMSGQATEYETDGGFARGSQQDGTPQCPQFSQAAQQGQILFGRGTKAYPRVYDEMLPCNTSSQRQVYTGRQAAENIADNLTPLVAAHIRHQYNRNMVLADQACHGRVAAQCPDIVDKRCSSFESLLCDPGFIGIDGDDDFFRKGGMQRLNDRYHTGQLLLLRDRGRVR